MGVYIKGMKMPELKIGKVIKMELLNDNGVVSIGIMTGGYSCCEEWTYYEASEVPEPHGRLIDADVLKEKYVWLWPSIEHFLPQEKAVRLSRIDDAPTVIEAEE